MSGRPNRAGGRKEEGKSEADSPKTPRQNKRPKPPPSASSPSATPAPAPSVVPPRPKLSDSPLASGAGNAARRSGNKGRKQSIPEVSVDAPSVQNSPVPGSPFDLSASPLPDPSSNTSVKRTNSQAGNPAPAPSTPTSTSLDTSRSPPSSPVSHTHKKRKLPAGQPAGSSPSLPPTPASIPDAAPPQPATPAPSQSQLSVALPEAGPQPPTPSSPPPSDGSRTPSRSLRQHAQQDYAKLAGLASLPKRAGDSDPADGSTSVVVLNRIRKRKSLAEAEQAYLEGPNAYLGFTPPSISVLDGPDVDPSSTFPASSPTRSLSATPGPRAASRAAPGLGGLSRSITSPSPITISGLFGQAGAGVIDQSLAELEAKRNLVNERLQAFQDTGGRKLKMGAEPARNKVHWDYLLEEAEWMANDFKRERKWQTDLAKNISKAVQKHHRNTKKQAHALSKKDEADRKRLAQSVSKHVANFWSNITSLIRAKHKAQVEQRKKEAMDRHLEFLVHETERYSTLVAASLSNKLPEREANKEALRVLSSSAQSAADSYGVGVGCIDVAVGKEPGAQSARPSTGAAAASPQTAQTPSVTAPARPRSARLRQSRQSPLSSQTSADHQAAESGPGPESSPKSSSEQPQPQSSFASPLPLPLPSSQPSSSMLSPRSSSRLRGRGAVPSAAATPAPAPSAAAQAQADSADAADRDYVEVESEEDDETTLEKEEREAAAAGEQTAEEVAALQEEGDVPLEDLLPPELLAAYGLDQEDDSDEDEEEGSPAPSPSAPTVASSPSEMAIDPAPAEPEPKPAGPSAPTPTHRSSQRLAAARKQMEEDSESESSQSDDEGDATARLLDDREPLGSGQVADKALVLDGARTEEERVMMAAAQASAAQPQGFTLASTKVKTKVPFLLRGNLREYQHIGLDWLVSMYNNGLNGILADEMGLGKTIMTIATLASLACEKGIWGQHLIVVPTSVIINWEMEFKRWLPGFKILTYYGNQKQRRDKRRGWNDPNAFHVCITSYQLVLRDRKIFGRKKWHYLILDEAHHIKNFASQKWQVLIQFSTFRRLLLTGTPLQNNLMELWSLMHFLMPHVFQSQKEFKAWFANPVTSMSEGKEQVNQQIINRLHGVLRPFLLRRLKRDVEQQLPKKFEHVVLCRLSKRQRQLYEDFMANAGTKETLAGSNFLGLMNVLMQLRKVCNHPDLFEGRPIISPFDQIRPLLYSTASAATQATELAPFQALSRPLLHALVALHADRTVPNLCDSTWAARDITQLRTPSHVIAIAGATLPEHLATPPALPADLSSGPPVPRSLQMEAFAVPALNLTSGMSAWQSYWHGRIQQRQEARQARFSHVDYLNRLRCEIVPPLPVYPPNLLRTLRLEHPIYDVHSIAADPARVLDFPSPLRDAIRLPAQRSADLQDILTRFVCFIPRARAPPIEMHVSHPSSSQQTDKEVLETALESEVSPLCDAFHVPNVRMQVNFPDKRLLQWDCGKLQALDRLLRKLKAEGHRVLVFTQMTRMLDILEAFLNVCGYNYLRLDGATKVEDRQRLMERFNTDSRMFCFILSTRSGGIGINLTGADTVVFYDTDWNPSMDQQAQDRCHRIGQTREVHVYRLVTESTVEENILKKSQQKQFMNNMVIGDGQFNTEFFDKLDPRELLGLTKINDFLPPAGQEQHINTYALPRMRVDRAAMELAMSRAEDPSDRIAAKKLQDEQAADSAEMDADEEADEAGRSRLPKLDVESDMSPIEQYAMRFAEIVDPVIKEADRAQAEQDLRSQERKWQDDRNKKQHLAPPAAAGSAVKMETDENGSSSASAGPSGEASGSDPSASSGSGPGPNSSSNAAFSLYGNPMHPNSSDSTASRQRMGQSFGRFRPGVISELAMKLDRQARQEAEAAGYYLSDEESEDEDFFYVPPSRSAAASSSTGPVASAPSASAEDDMDGQAAFRAQVEHMQSQDMKYDPELFAPPSSPREDEWYSASVVEKSRESYQREDSWWGLLATPQDLTRMMRQREKKPPPPPARPLLSERERRLGLLGLSSRPGHNFRTVETPTSFRIRIPTKLIRNYVPLRLQKAGVPSAAAAGATPIKRERTGPPTTGPPSKSLVGGPSDPSASKGGAATYGASATPNSAPRKKDPKAPAVDPTKAKKDGKLDGKLVKKDDKTATTPAKAGVAKAKTAGTAAVTTPDPSKPAGPGAPPSAPGAASPAVPEERHRVAWTRDEDALLVVAVEDFGPNWTLIADILRHYPQVTGRLRSPQECQQEYIRRTGRDPAASASATPNTKEEKALLMEERAGAVGAGVGGLRATTRERSRGRITAGLKRRRPEDGDSGASSSPDPGSALKKRSATPAGGAASSSSAVTPRPGDKSLREPAPPPPRDPFGFGTDTLRHYVNIAMKQINSAKIMVRESLRVQTLEMESTAMWQTRSHASHKKALTDAHARLGLPAHALGKTLMPHQIIQLRGRRAPVMPPTAQNSVIMTAPPQQGMPPLTVNVPPNYSTNPPPMSRYPSQGPNPSGMPVMSMGSSGMAVNVPGGTPGSSGAGPNAPNRSGSMMPMMVSNQPGQPAPMMPYRSPTSSMPGGSQGSMTPGMNMMPGSTNPGTPSMVMMRSTSSGAGPSQPNLSAPSPTHTGPSNMSGGMQPQSMSSVPGGPAGSTGMRTMTMPMNPQGSPTRTAPGYAMSVSGQPGVSMSMSTGGMSGATHPMQQGGSTSVTVTPMGQMPAMSMSGGPGTPSQGKKNGPKQKQFAKGTPGVMSLPIQNVGMAMGPGTAPAMSTGMAPNMQNPAGKKPAQPQPSGVGGSAQTVKPGMSMTIPGNSGSTTMTMPPTLVMAPQAMNSGRQMQGAYYMPIDPKSSAGNRSPSPNSATSSMMTQQYQISIQPGNSQGQRPAMTYALNVAQPSGSVPTSQSPGPQGQPGQGQSGGMSTGQMGGQGQGQGQTMRYTTSDQNTYITMAPSSALAPGSMTRGQSTGTTMTLPQSSMGQSHPNQSPQPNQGSRSSGPSGAMQQMPGYATYSVSSMARPSSSGATSSSSNTSSLPMTYAMSGQPSATESSASFSSSAAAPGALSAGYAQTGSRPPPAHAQLNTFVTAVVNAYPHLKDNVNGILTRSDMTDEQKMHSISRLYTTDKGSTSSSQQTSASGAGMARPQGAGQSVTTISYTQPNMTNQQKK